jgi:ubiquinone/menaquinone biosynthesis C-methylase UbiE
VKNELQENFDAMRIKVSAAEEKSLPKSFAENDMKARIVDYWNQHPCGAEFSNKPPESKDFYDEIEQFRYSSEPEVLRFAQFEKFRGQVILEVGVGMGTDFLQWVRAGAKAFGLDASPVALGHARLRLELNNLKAGGLLNADAECLPFLDDAFELVYSWGVLHHADDPSKAIQEILRVLKPGGAAKIMVYHRHSLAAFYLWLKRALLAGRPWQTFSCCIKNYMESPGTAAFTRREIRAVLTSRQTTNICMASPLTYWDRLAGSNKFFRLAGRLVASLLGRLPVGWFLLVEFQKARNGRAAC